MANPWNPHSPSDDPTGSPPPHAAPGEPSRSVPPAGDVEDELSLDDYDTRPQQRPRLPEHRRERAVEEISASPSPPREPPPSAPPAPILFESPAAPTPWEPVSAHEIEAFDVAPGNQPAMEPAAPVPSMPAAEPVRKPEVAAGLDDLEEFIARSVTAGPATDKPAKVRRPLSLLEKVSFGAGGAVLVFLSIWLIRAVTSVAGEGRERSDGWPDVPMKGSLVTISEAASNWRMRTDSDRVAQMEIILPTPGLQMPDIIPQVTFTIDSSASSDGYLRFIFKDSEGKPRGDTRVVQVKGGQLVDLGRGEIIKSATEGSTYGSYGLINIHAYHSYTGNNQPRWSVEVAESPDYDASDKDWMTLGTFDVRDALDR